MLRTLIAQGLFKPYELDYNKLKQHFGTDDLEEVKVLTSLLLLKHGLSPRMFRLKVGQYSMALPRAKDLKKKYKLLPAPAQ